MVSAVSSSSAALKVLQVQAPQQASTGEQNQDPLKQALDPRSLVILPAQSFDALLKVWAELRGGSDPVQASQSPPTIHPGGGPAQTSMLAAAEPGPDQGATSLKHWYQQMDELKLHSRVPLNSALMPWNSADVIQQLKDDDAHHSNHRERARQIRASDALVLQSMAETPPEDVAQIRAFGGEVWYEYSQTFDRPSDQEFARNIKNYTLYGLGLNEPIDPSNEISQALLNGTARVIRASTILGSQFKKDVSYDMYAFNSQVNHYTQVGEWGRTGHNEDYMYELEKKYPTMKVSYIAAYGDFGFILYPKTGAAAAASTAVAQGQGTGTATPPATAPIH
ncbi:hypothetical protein MKK75_02610 [Methylobacterium sp. J-030]|uniref:hypothetical protein n=1 Tax=Methylobacterium sp. J-030 TaxID=2836627 RepID=UPI001FBAA936|nr:hypothetical protein [Methylobacterium sp. J-030]MCJ2067705.1 hypothetical protein [Methylobacterium sp. J-030]